MDSRSKITARIKAKEASIVAYRAKIEAATATVQEDRDMLAVYDTADEAAADAICDCPDRCKFVKFSVLRARTLISFDLLVGLL